MGWIRERVWSVAYNLDRAIASLFGAPPQATISAEAERAYQRNQWWGRAVCWVLNTLDPGHCVKADAHADRLEEADDHVEK